MRIGTTQCSDWQGPGSAEFWTASQKSKEDAATDRRTAREASLCLDSTGICQQSHERTSRRCCAGISRLGGGCYKLARSAMREQGRSNTGIASLLHVKMSPMSALGPTGEWQEHLDAIVSFAGAGLRRRLFQGLDIFTIKWAMGDLPGECRFLLNTQLMFLKKDPTSKQFDDDEWIRSLTEEQEVTTDITADSVTYDQHDVDTKKVDPFRWESSFGSTSRGDSWHSVSDRSQPSRLRCGRSEWAPQVALRPWPSSTRSSSMDGRQAHSGSSGPESKSMNKLLWDDRVEGCG